MRTAFVIYTLFLLLEGILAWKLGRDGLLLAIVAVGLALYASLGKRARPMAEGCRLLVSVLLAVAGPLQYQDSLIPLLLCFIALPHYLAATQALAESAARPEAALSRTKRNALIFSIAFYSSIGLVFLLARGLEPDYSRLTTSLLALLGLLGGLAAWELSRLPRLAAAEPDKSAGRWRRLVLPISLLALAGLLFSGPLPLVSQLLCRLSPHWRMNPIEFKNRPPHPPPTARVAEPADIASKLGVDESAVTGEHALPPRSNLKPGEDLRFYLKFPDPAQAASMAAKGPVYLRSHTLNRFSDNKWSAEVSGGVWINDADDGAADGIVSLATPPPVPLVPHEVFAMGADGHTLPALPGLVRIGLPRVYAIPGDTLQTTVAGNIRYQAVSAPVFFRDLPDPGLLQPGEPESAVHRKPLDGDLGLQMKRLADSIFGTERLPAGRIALLAKFLAEHYSYSTIMDNPHSLGPLENFLFDERRGHCDFYATAAALLLREGGMAARIAYGFASDEIDPEAGLVLVRDSNAHAWTEVYLEKYGWTVCDFTPSPFVGHPKGPKEVREKPSVPDPSSFTDAAQDAKPPDPAKVTTDLPLYTKVFNWFKKQPWLQPVMHYGLWVLAGLGALLAALKVLRGSPPDPEEEVTKAREALDRQPGYFREFLRISAAAGHPKPDGRTPLEHFRALESAGLPVPPLRPLLHYHCATRYEDAPPDKTTEQNFFADLKAFADTVLAPAPGSPQAPA